MYRNVLVPLDGTAFGEHALPAALAVARRTGAELHLVHVHVPGTPGHGGLGPDRVYLDAMRDRLARRGVRVTARLEDGPLARTLAGAAAAADLVVMATHARAGVSRLWHHGVAAYLTRHVAVPILVVRGNGREVNLDAEPPFGHVLLPLGGSPYSERVLDHAVETGRAFGSRFTLLKVVPPPIEVGYSLLGQDGHVNPFLLDTERQTAGRYLEDVAARLRSQGLQAATHVEISASTTDGILRYAAESGADLVAMETHGLGGLAHALDEGVVAPVIRESPVPVLVHHDETAVAREQSQAYASSIGRGMGWAHDRTAAAR